MSDHFAKLPACARISRAPAHTQLGGAPLRRANTVHLRNTRFKDGWFAPLWAKGLSVKVPLP